MDFMIFNYYVMVDYKSKCMRYVLFMEVNNR